MKSFFDFLKFKKVRKTTPKKKKKKHSFKFLGCFEFFFAKMWQFVPPPQKVTLIKTIPNVITNMNSYTQNIPSKNTNMYVALFTLEKKKKKRDYIIIICDKIILPTFNAKAQDYKISLT
jgi:hypothetical protein